MAAASIEKQQHARTEEFMTLARSIADRSSDPDATYESFLLGLEMGLACGSLDTEVSRPLGIGCELIHSAPRDRVIFDPRKPMIRKAPATRFVSGAEFPTEWTLDH